MEKQTNWANIICIVALVLGFFGTCCNLFGAGSVAMTERFVSVSAPMQREMLQAQITYRPLLLLNLALGVAQSVFLLVAAALALRNLERYRGLLRLAFKVAMAVVALDLAVGVFVQSQQLSAPLPTDGVPNLPWMRGFMQFARWFGIVGGVVWALFKIGFFVLVDRYLGRPPTPPAPVPPAPLGPPPEGF